MSLGCEKYGCVSRVNGWERGGKVHACMHAIFLYVHVMYYVQYILSNNENEQSMLVSGDYTG